MGFSPQEDETVQQGLELVGQGAFDEWRLNRAGAALNTYGLTYTQQMHCYYAVKKELEEGTLYKAHQEAAKYLALRKRIALMSAFLAPQQYEPPARSDDRFSIRRHDTAFHGLLRMVRVHCLDL